MKNLYFNFILFLFLFQSCNTDKTMNDPIKENTNSSENYFDAALAKKLKADDYGMHKYVMALLKKGPNRNQDKATADQLQKAHMDNINRLAEEGILVLAGPFLDDDDLRGIYIFDVETIEEAKKLTETDPAIQEGRLIMELHPWYGSAGVMQINETHNKISKIKM